MLKLSAEELRSEVEKNEEARNAAVKREVSKDGEKFKPLIIVGPSGVGKSTLISGLTDKYPNSFGFSISFTTRQPRPGEKHGVNYFYITKEEYDKMVEADDFIEATEVHSNYYGTAKS